MRNLKVIGTLDNIARPDARDMVFGPEDWPRALSRAEAEVTGEPLMQATSDALNVPPRDKRDVAIEAAVRAIRELLACMILSDAEVGCPRSRWVSVKHDGQATIDKIDALLGKGEGE